MNINFVMAKASGKIAYFVSPLEEALASVYDDDSVTVSEVDNRIEISASDADPLTMEVLANSLLELSGLDESEVTFSVEAQDGKAIITASWEEQAKRLNDDDDEEEFDDSEEEEDEDVTEDTEVIDMSKPKTKKVGNKVLSVLITPAAQKMVSSMYSMSNGEDMSRFPQFWQELDDLCKKYRGESGYQPDVDSETASANLKASLSSYVELAKKKKKKGFKEGRGGLMTVMMRYLAKNGDKVDAAWNNLDINALISLISGMGSDVIDAVSAERDKRGLDDSEDEGEEDTSEEADTSEEEKVKEQVSSLDLSKFSLVIGPDGSITLTPK